MITINLLPADLRPMERTPLPRFLVILVGLVLGLSGLIVLSIYHFSKLNRVRVQIAAEEDTITALEPSEVEYNKVRAQLASILQQEAALKALYAGRTIWWKKMDQLTDLTPSFVGLNRLAFKEQAPSRTGESESSGTLTMDCVVAQAEEKRVARFRRILKGEVPPEWGLPSDVRIGEKFIGDFVDGEIQDGGWRQVPPADAEEIPALEFQLQLRLKPKVASQTPGNTPRK
jgi:hypothetical protein